ncbi:AraC family transcriptional regulator [uncultured Shewanella sp.]|uniref:AraC family transcriptional regulator n=1 Tax=uncultured Shewanella sp. TaxID=173975 RepID=UPI0026058E9E|nr:AraC family transcriptional regulator [uncultured Shewanella sp.]
MEFGLTAYPTVSAAAVLDLYDVLSCHEVITPKNACQLNFKRQDLMGVEKRVPLAFERQLWALGSKSPRLSNIGFAVGTQINRNAQGVLSHLLSVADDLREALYLYKKYIVLMNQCEKIDVVEYGWGIRILYLTDYDYEFTQVSTERSLSAMVTWAKYLTQNKLTLRKASFKHNNVANLPDYLTIFGDKVCFNQKETFLDISNSVASLKIKSANAYIKNMLVKRIEQEMKVLYIDASLRDKVILIIRQYLHSQTCSSDFVAHKLNMSRQTLHRKLTKEGLNFKIILSEVRQEKVIGYLLNKSHSVESIGSMLGFKDASSFYRAFKSWFNMTPKMYRLALLSSEEPEMITTSAPLAQEQG